VVENRPQEMSFLLLLIENSIRSEKQPEIEKYLYKLFDNFTIPDILKNIAIFQKNNEHLPVDINLIKTAIFEKIIKFSEPNAGVVQ
ncbi:hypothetical protein HGB07_06325, partial [Candidatus Roizmanbacteria bacterium]|nr:hypothetical protein [Candidatus Roizmanbacteria bacterium]